MNKIKIALLLSYICLASISAAIITPALPHIQQSFEISQGALGWVMSIFLAGYVIGQLIYGPLANRFGGLIALRAGLFINLIGILICLIAVYYHSYIVFLVGRLVTALGAASGLACTFILMHELLSEEQFKNAVSFTIVSFTAGIGLAVTLGGIITQYLYWPDCFWLLFTHGVLMLVLTWQFKKPMHKPIALHPVLILKGYISVLKSYRLVVFSLIVGVISVFSYGYSTAAPLYAHRILHLSASVYGYWNLVNMLGMLGGGLLSAYLIKKYKPKKVLISGIVLMIPGLVSLISIVLTNASSVGWFFITTMYLYLFGSLLFPSASYFASHAITDRANASSMMSFINMGSATLSVVVLAYLPFHMIESFAITITVFFIFVIALSWRRILMINDLFSL